MLMHGHTMLTLGVLVFTAFHAIRTCASKASNAIVRFFSSNALVNLQNMIYIYGCSFVNPGHLK